METVPGYDCGSLAERFQSIRQSSLKILGAGVNSPSGCGPGLKRPVKNAFDGFYNHVGAYMHQYVVDSAYVIVV